MNKDKWLPNILGDVNSTCWEVSIVKESNKHGQISFGWFNENKLLVSANTQDIEPLAPGLGDIMVKIAHLYADYLNRGETPTIDFK